MKWLALRDAARNGSPQLAGPRPAEPHPRRECNPRLESRWTVPSTPASGTRGYKLQVTSYKLQVTSYKLQVAGWRSVLRNDLARFRGAP